MWELGFGQKAYKVDKIPEVRILIKSLNRLLRKFCIKRQKRCNGVLIMEIFFTDFYQIERLAPLIVDGQLNHKWNKQYFSDKKGASRLYPDDLGSGQTLLAPKLFSQDLLPVEVQQVSQTANGLIYVLTSTYYPILYVGVSASNLREGLFRNGRMSHHLRKILAIHSVSTSHTQGWQMPAIKRYEDRITIKDEDISLASCSTDLCCVASDLQIAFGYSNEKNWNSKDYEGTAFDFFESKLRMAHADLDVMNTKKMNRSNAQIFQPSNLAEVLSEFGSLNLSDIDHSLKLRLVSKRYAQLKINDPNASLILIAALSRVFKRLWVESWHSTLYSMAEEWEVIDECAELALDVALHSSAKSGFYKEFIEILDVYSKATHACMHDLDAKGEWKLVKIKQLLQISKSKLSK